MAYSVPIEWHKTIDNQWNYEENMFDFIIKTMHADVLARWQITHQLKGLDLTSLAPFTNMV